MAPGDILGLDVYTRIGYRFLGRDEVSSASSDWDDRVLHWREVAQQQGKRAWVTEAQAEPWEVDGRVTGTPRSFQPADVTATFAGLKDAGYTTVLLWGSEYWLWRADQGDQRWLEEVQGLLDRESRAPALRTAG